MSQSFHCLSTLSITLCMLDNFACFFVVYCLFFKFTIFKNFFQEYHLSVKQCGSRSGLLVCLARSEFNFFPRLSADTKEVTSRHRVILS